MGVDGGRKPAAGLWHACLGQSDCMGFDGGQIRVRIRGGPIPAFPQRGKAQEQVRSLSTAGFQPLHTLAQGVQFIEQF